MKNEEPMPSFEDLQRLAAAADARSGAGRGKAGSRRIPEGKPEPSPAVADLVKLGGRQAGDTVVFGGDGETTLAFKPSWLRKTAAWAVELTGRASREERKRVLSASGRGLWDRTTDGPDAVCEAAQSLIDYVERRGDRASAKENAIATQRCLLAMYEALQSGKGRKLQVAFDLLSSPDAWAGTDKVDVLQEQCLLLAGALQRPPTKKELKEQFERKGFLIDKSSYAELLRHAGLSWLRQEGRAG